MKTVQDLVSFNQANFAALADAGRIFAAGVQELSQKAFAAGQAQLSGGMAHLQSLSGVKSVEGAIALQTRAVRSTFEAGLAETSRLAEAAFNLVEQTSAPLATRADAALQVFARAA